MGVREALTRAMKSLRHKEDGWAQKDLRQKINDLLDDLTDRDLRSESSPIRTGMWIFRQLPSRETYTQAILDLLDDAIQEARHEVAIAHAESADWSCACRCKEHQMAACPLCLNVFGCPVHNEPDPRTLRLDLLKNPLDLAAALNAELRNLGCDDLVTSWNDLGREERGSWAEACRLIITTRIK